MMIAHFLPQLINSRMPVQGRNPFMHIHTHDGKASASILSHQNCPAARWRFIRAK
jgi:hypothetical protein